MKAFHIGALSGVVATCGANGVLFVWRNPGASIQYIEKIRVTCAPLVHPSAGNDQEFGVSLHEVTAFPANYTGGTDVSALYRARSQDVMSTVKRTPTSVLTTGNVRIATTAALTSPTGETIATQPWIHASKGIEDASESAFGGDPFEFVWENPVQRKWSDNLKLGCLRLEPDTGFTVQAPVAIANSLSVRVSVSVDWLEV